MKRILWWLPVLCLAVFLFGCTQQPTQERALERAEAYAQAIDHAYETPGKIYDLLCQDFRDQMDETAFCEAFAKERSYPYITPLYINDPVVTVDGQTAHVVYDQAARLIGMTYEIDMVFENGDWYICDWASFLDGSYLEKFEDIPYSIDWYYDTERWEEGD